MTFDFLTFDFCQDPLGPYGKQNEDIFQMYVNVGDIGDTPPAWQTIPSTCQFNESTPPVSFPKETQNLFQ